MKPSRYRTTFSVIASIFAMCVAMLVLAGWILNIDFLKGMGSPITMKANLAIAILATVLALLCVTRAGVLRALGMTAALFAAMVGALSLAEHLFGINFGIDTLLFDEPAGLPGTVSPGRMGPNGALSLMLLGSALFLQYRSDERSAKWATLFASVPAVTTLMALVGYLYGATQLNQVARSTAIAPHTAFVLLALAVGVLSARPERSPIALMTQSTAGALLARRLLPLALMLPIALGWLRIRGQEANLYDLSFGTALLVTSLVVIFLAVISWTAASVNASEVELAKAASALAGTERQLRLVTDQAPVMLAYCDTESRYTFVNKTYAERFGLKPRECLGKHISEVLGQAAYGSIEPYVQRVLRGEPVEYEIEVPYARIGRRYMRAMYAPEFDDTHKVVAWVAAVMDITERRRAEQALRASEQSFSTMFRSLPLPVMLSRFSDGAIVDANDAFFAITGYSHEEVIGRTTTEIGLRRDRKRLLDLVQGAGFAENQEMTIFRKNGEPRAVVANLNVIELQGEKYVLASVADVTERKRAEAELAYQLELTRTITNNTQSCLLMMDTEGRGTFANPAAERVTGFKPEELIGHVLHNKIHHTRPDGTPFPIEECPIDRALPLNEAVVNYEETFVHRDGHFYPVRCAARPILKAGRPIGTVIEVQDITHERRLFEAEHLARREAEGANRLKDEFLATLSHELRTPLNAMLGWTDMLRRHSVAADRVPRVLDIIYTNARQQQALVEDLLDISRILSGKMPLRLADVPVGSMIRQAADVLRPSADAKAIAIEIDVHPSVTFIRADPDRLQQVLWNLLSNAVKFTPDGGAVRITVRQSGGGIEIAISDTGVGIAGEFLPHIFELFRQADSSPTRIHGGLGLGLSIAKQIVDLHGGRIQADSPGPGAGTTFTIYLPAQPQEGVPEPIAAEFTLPSIDSEVQTGSDDDGVTPHSRL